jgi:hypothetical protein
MGQVSGTGEFGLKTAVQKQLQARQAKTSDTSQGRLTAHLPDATQVQAYLSAPFLVHPKQKPSRPQFLHALRPHAPCRFSPAAPKKTFIRQDAQQPSLFNAGQQAPKRRRFIVTQIVLPQQLVEHKLGSGFLVQAVGCHPLRHWHVPAHAFGSPIQRVCSTDEHIRQQFRHSASHSLCSWRRQQFRQRQHLSPCFFWQWQRFQECCSSCGSSCWCSFWRWRRFRQQCLPPCFFWQWQRFQERCSSCGSSCWRTFWRWKRCGQWQHPWSRLFWQRQRRRECCSSCRSPYWRFFWGWKRCGRLISNGCQRPAHDVSN